MMPTPTPGTGWEGLVLDQSHLRSESDLSLLSFHRTQLPVQQGPALEGTTWLPGAALCRARSSAILFRANSSCSLCRFEEIVSDGIGTTRQAPYQILSSTVTR